MIEKPTALLKQPVLKPAEDFYRLRREGIGFIEQMGSRQWTDYNSHDPGITILEALCYAITDLAYRIGWDVKDLLTLAPPANPPSGAVDPYPNQAFFTAREILTVNPATPDDFRRLLIDLDQIRNAWVFGKTCACDVRYYAWCEAGQLTLSYQKPADPLLQSVQVDPTGLYEVLLELEADPELGDLNDRKIETTRFTFDDENKPVSLKLELCFPALELTDEQAYTDFIGFDETTNDFTRTITGIESTISRSKTDTASVTTPVLHQRWRDVFFVSFIITFDAGSPLLIQHAALRLFGGVDSKKRTVVDQPADAPETDDSFDLTKIVGDVSVLGSIQRYRQKLRKTGESVKLAKTALHNHRNLGEDYCRVRVVAVEDVAVCADVDVAPDADIERIQARIWFEIEQYLNPPVPFYTLQELLDAPVPVEDIFNGPALDNGFIKPADLTAAGLKTVLRTSDIINRLMNIDGVISVNQLLLSKYDAEGNVVKGAADPTQTDTGLTFDPATASAKWQLSVTAQHQPRLYYNQSRFLFYKNGLPFLPRTDEATDTLIQLRGESERPKINPAATNGVTNDLPAPVGTFRQPEDYFPVQYTFPLTYGIGPEGLPVNATPERRAQAKQLKAYLMIFEQLLGNTMAQVANTSGLFSLSQAVTQTYFSRAFTEADIQGYDSIVSKSLSPVLQGLAETPAEFEERRNRFLDHLMARFGEQFGEYALMLTNLQGQQVARKRLIDDKISFLKAYPAISHDRAKAVNYRQNTTDPANVAGLKHRVSLLLGYPDLTFAWQFSGGVPEGVAPFTADRYELTDKNDRVWLEGTLMVSEVNQETARQQVFEQLRRILERMTQPDSYEIAPEADQFRLSITAKNGTLLGRYPDLIKTQKDAQVIVDELSGWSSNERAILVEHLLLRPKFPGDALYPACADGDCGTCGDEDPYSFRLTYVMPGWTAPFNENLEMRRFANRTIQQETPAHLLGKTCWVGNDGFTENLCDPVIVELAKRLETTDKTAGGLRPTESEACACALGIYSAFSRSFARWYDDKTQLYVHPDALTTALEAEFTATVDPIGIACTTTLDATLWANIQVLMVKHFGQIAFSGWQFERFADAWRAWLLANAAIDWTEQRLQERVEVLLAGSVLAGTVPAADRTARLCRCAAEFLTQYGQNFYHWMSDTVKAGVAFVDLNFRQFDPDKPTPLTLCTDLAFEAGTIDALKTLLTARYSTYTGASYRLWTVVNLLSKLRNTYPGATLHDCDDGSDQNPVRLGSTALGSYPAKKP